MNNCLRTNRFIRYFFYFVIRYFRNSLKNARPLSKLRPFFCHRASLGWIVKCRKNCSEMNIIRTTEGIFSGIVNISPESLHNNWNFVITLEIVSVYSHSVLQILRRKTREISVSDANITFHVGILIFLFWLFLVTFNVLVRRGFYRQDH